MANPHDHGAQEDYGFPEQAHWAEYSQYSGDYSQPLPPTVPMSAHPEVEEPVDEKTRLRRHEESLLPSQPPDEEEAGPSTVETVAPTAPVLPDDHILQDYQHVTTPGEEGVPHAVRSDESLQTVVVNGSSSGPSELRTAGDDKQELERQRLFNEASAPHEEDHEEVNGEAGEAGEGPSAPVFDEDDQLVGGTAHADESLPRYQR